LISLGPVRQKRYFVRRFVRFLIAFRVEHSDG